LGRCDARTSMLVVSLIGLAFGAALLLVGLFLYLA
jgi:hypothetical protein